MLKATVFTAEGTETIDPEKISDVIGSEGVLLWVDVVDLDDRDMEMLTGEFSIYDLVLEDVAEHGQRPKLEVYGGWAHLVGYAATGDRTDMAEVDLLVGAGWMVSVRSSSRQGRLFDVAPTIERFERTRAGSIEVGLLLYMMFDDMVDRYFDVVDRAEDSLEEIEADLFAVEDEGADPDHDRRVQRNLLHERRALILMRRRIVPMRDVALGLLRGEMPWIDPASMLYMQNVLDHLLRLVDQIDTQRELLGNVVDAHLALQANRMNEVMKKMTSWGAILIVASLIAGIYGMNFSNMPELHWHFGYFAALGLMVVCTAGLWVYFKRKDWL